MTKMIRDVYVAILEGVYDHGIVAVALTPVEIDLAVCEYLSRKDEDGYHSVRIHACAWGLQPARNADGAEPTVVGRGYLGPKRTPTFIGPGDKGFDIFERKYWPRSR